MSELPFHLPGDPKPATTTVCPRCRRTDWVMSVRPGSVYCCWCGGVDSTSASAGPAPPVATTAEAKRCPACNGAEFTYGPGFLERCLRCGWEGRAEALVPANAAPPPPEVPVYERLPQEARDNLDVGEALRAFGGPEVRTFVSTFNGMNFPAEARGRQGAIDAPDVAKAAPESACREGASQPPGWVSEPVAASASFWGSRKASGEEALGVVNAVFARLRAENDRLTTLLERKERQLRALEKAPPHTCVVPEPPDDFNPAYHRGRDRGIHDLVDAAWAAIGRDDVTAGDALPPVFAGERADALLVALHDLRAAWAKEQDRAKGFSATLRDKRAEIEELQRRLRDAGK